MMLSWPWVLESPEGGTTPVAEPPSRVRGEWREEGASALAEEGGDHPGHPTIHLGQAVGLILSVLVGKQPNGRMTP